MCQFFTRFCRHCSYEHAKFGMTLQYLNTYVSSQKFPQTFLYRSKKYCKSFKSFGELGKKVFSNQFLQVAILPSAKNSIILTAPYSEVSSAIYNLFLSELLQYIGNMFKKSLNVNDAWFGFYSHFKKGTLHVHMNNAGVNGLTVF